MRMARVNITVPDEVLDRSRAAGVNVSRIASAALVAELERQERIEALDRYLDELDVEQGPASRDARARAATWADRVLDDRDTADVGAPSR